MEGSLYDPALRLKETILLPGAGAKPGGDDPKPAAVPNRDAFAVSIVHANNVTAPTSRPALVVEEEHIGMTVAPSSPPKWLENLPVTQGKGSDSPGYPLARWLQLFLVRLSQ